ncbi:MAG: DNA primase [Bacteroidaceae bacterium]|nr:DNA primase [Bacteroidaceae bacterium]
MIDRKTIDQVFQATDIVDVVSDFVTLRKAGVNYKGLCPFHEEKTPSFVVSPARGTCHCFGCGKGGSAINFLMELNNMTYPEAIRWLARKYNIEVVETGIDDKANAERKHREQLLTLNQWANDWFQHSLHDTSEGQGIGLSYLRQRGIRDDIIRKFQLGYCPASGYGLGDAARRDSMSIDNLVETGLCIKTERGKLRDRFFGRVIFPVHNYMGKVVAFGGRILEKKDNVGKYLNSPESTVYHKSSELYGLYFAKQAIQRHDCCYLVEGYTDVISMHQCGIANVVASSGTALTHDQIRLIKKFTSNLTVLYDGDAAGIKASMRGIDMLLEHGLNIKVLLLPDGDDPDSFARKHSAEEYVNFIEQNQVDFIRFKTNLLLADTGNDIRARADVINNIAESIARVDDSIARSLYIKDCAQLTDIREDDVRETVDKMRNRLYLEKMQTPQAPLLSPQRGKIHSPLGETEGASSMVNGQSSTAKAETKLMKFLVRYGERSIGDIETDDGQYRSVSFAEYINSRLQAEDYTLATPIYADILSEILANLNTPSFTTISYLLSHPNDAIRSCALSLATDREQTIAVDDKAITDNLYENADNLLNDLMLAVLTDEIIELSHLIASDTLTPDQMAEKAMRLAACKKIQLQLRKK